MRADVDPSERLWVAERLDLMTLCRLVRSVGSLRALKRRGYDRDSSGKGGRSVSLQDARWGPRGRVWPTFTPTHYLLSYTDYDCYPRYFHSWNWVPVRGEGGQISG